MECLQRQDVLTGWDLPAIEGTTTDTRRAELISTTLVKLSLLLV